MPRGTVEKKETQVLGSDFAKEFGGKGRVAWEAAALALAERDDSVVHWPMVDVALSTPPGKDGVGHTATAHVTADLFSIGTPEDYLRLPLTPAAAQSIANLGGFLLPTRRLVQAIQRTAGLVGAQLVPQLQENRAPAHLMEDYVKHHATVQKQLKDKGVPFSTLVSGHAKDVVVSNIYKPGHVVIYGWFWPEGMTPPMINKTQRFGQPIQGMINNHDSEWVDYSHGIRFVAPVMTVDGQEMLTEDVMRHPVLSALVSDEGPLHAVRYPASNEPKPYRPVDRSAYASKDVVLYKPDSTSLADQGLAVMLERERRRP